MMMNVTDLNFNKKYKLKLIKVKCKIKKYRTKKQLIKKKR